MDMLVPALLVTFGHWLTTRLEMLTWTSGNITRPILVGPIIGLLLGDIKTGIILGGALKAFIYWRRTRFGRISQRYSKFSSIKKGILYTGT